MNYLRTRKRGNSISKFVQVPVPLDLKAAYGGKRYIEKYLRGEGSVLSDKVRQEVALISSDFEAKRGRDKDISIAEEKARREATRQTFEWLMANASDGPDTLSSVLPSNEGEDFGQTVTRIKEILSKTGETVPESEFQRIGNAITDGDFDALSLFRKGLRPIAAPRQSRTLDQTVKDYFKFVAHDESAAWTRQTTSQYGSTVRLFTSFFGANSPIASVDRESAVRFLDSVALLDPKWGRYGNAKDFTFDELLAKYPGKLTNRTINRHHIALRGLFDWAIDRRYYSKEEGNPFGFKLRKKGNRTKNPFTIEMLNALLELPNPKPEKHSWLTTRPWLTLLALYNGMREDEIGSLTVDDITEADGVKFFAIRDAKTLAGIRRVPIHSVILRYGFLDYVKNIGQGTLWPGLKPGGKDKNSGLCHRKEISLLSA